MTYELYTCIRIFIVQKYQEDEISFRQQYNLNSIVLHHLYGDKTVIKHIYVAKHQ